MLACKNLACAITDPSRGEVLAENGDEFEENEGRYPPPVYRQYPSEHEVIPKLDRGPMATGAIASDIQDLQSCRHTRDDCGIPTERLGGCSRGDYSGQESLSRMGKNARRRSRTHLEQDLANH